MTASQVISNMMMAERNDGGGADSNGIAEMNGGYLIPLAPAK